MVVFDLGGVLARICHSWEEAAEAAGVPHELAADRRTPLADFAGFDLYQAGRLSLDTYLRELALFVGCSLEDALRVHDCILVDEYPGVPQLVGELKALGLATGCLSNTNEAHWQYLALDGHFPTIQSLEHKMASHLVGLNKPDPAIFRLYAAQFGFRPEEIAYFDDHPLNVEAATSEGWQAWLINPNADTVAQMRAFLAGAGSLDASA